MNSDLLTAILALDSYNRGYGSGVYGLLLPTYDVNGNATTVVRLGNTTISRDSSSLKDDSGRLDIPAGFYPIAYALDLGGIVIADRGTDDNIGHADTGAVIC